MLTRHQILTYRAMEAVLQHLGNNPHVFCLYFVCKQFYTYYVMRTQTEYMGFEKYVNYGASWEIGLKAIQRQKIQLFFRMLFNGMIVADFHPLYSIFNVKKLGFFKVLVNITNFFYIVKKFKFHAKMNISLNEDNLFSDCSELECKMSSCVLENYKVHDDSFMVGCRSDSGVIMTSFFLLGEMTYFGVTCYSSLKLWLRYDRNIKFEVLKCFFCFGAFRDQVLAML